MLWLSNNSENDSTAPWLFANSITPVVSASSRCTKRRNFSPRERAQKSPAAIEETRAACKLRWVFCHENGTSIQPRGLSMASTERSSKRIEIGSTPGSSMKFGLATDLLQCFEPALHFFTHDVRRMRT